VFPADLSCHRLGNFTQALNSHRTSTQNARVILICKADDGPRARTQSDDTMNFATRLSSRCGRDIGHERNLLRSQRPPIDFSQLNSQRLDKPPSGVVPRSRLRS